MSDGQSEACREQIDSWPGFVRLYEILSDERACNDIGPVADQLRAEVIERRQRRVRMEEQHYGQDVQGEG